MTNRDDSKPPDEERKLRRAEIGFELRYHVGRSLHVFLDLLRDIFRGGGR